MKIMKFGGTSVGSAQRMKNMVSLVANAGGAFVVLSAMSGTTNSLLTLTQAIREGQTTNAVKLIDDLDRKYRAVAAELLPEPPLLDEANRRLDKIFGLLRDMAAGATLSPADEKIIVAQGEILSTNLVDLYMRHKGLDALLLDATAFLRLNPDGEPDTEYIRDNANRVLAENPGHTVYLTQGFICRNHNGDIDNLQRGGSDYTASLLGAAVNADEIQIWTDIDGMHNNDPRFVDNTKPVGELHFDEAAELAYFGAKILHPTCVLPAKFANIPVRLLNTMEPEAKGTVIYNALPTGTIKAVAAKDNITAIKIKSTHMLLAYGFLRRVFEVFERHHTPIDMITTSEVGVSVTIDNERALNDILSELNGIADITVDRDMVIICVVGDLEWHNRGFESRVLEAVSNIPVRMISYGGSNYNISMLVRKEDKIETLRLLSENIF